ncbi:MAG: translation elongation factor 4 [Patescibacteria group bacterium]
MDQARIRNFCIIAHIDHGKSTLADRLLEVTGTVEMRKMKDQLLDMMDLERERGITIKLQPARMAYKDHVLNLIDTPGHVDFTYEVSRSLAAVEGALLLVDATQGVQAQTLGNLYLAMEQNLTIIPIVNKIDLPNAQVDKVIAEIVGLIGCDVSDVLRASGKTGEGVPKILDAVITRIPAPQGNPSAPLRALIFDSKYDEFKGVVAYCRIVDGSVRTNSAIHLIGTALDGQALEVGRFTPQPVAEPELETGMIGYIVTALKDIEGVRVGDTITVKGAGAIPLDGYHEVKPMVYAGIFPKEGNEYERLRDAILKLKLSDASLAFEPEHSAALGFGFRCGMLGLLHLEIVQERLKREHNMEIVVTTPSVAYRVTTTDGAVVVIKSPAAFPDASRLTKVEEPWVKLDVVAPEAAIGGIMALVAEKRGIYKNTEYLTSGEQGKGRVVLHYEIPLSSILVDFYDRLKSASSGYASMNYELIGEHEADIVKLDILVAEEPVEALAALLPREETLRVGRAVVAKLKESLPRQNFEVKLQAAIGGKVIASERISAFRKDVLAKMSGGDVTRKNKLLDKQKKGKKRMAGHGSVDIPPETYLAVLRRDA